MKTIGWLRSTVTDTATASALFTIRLRVVSLDVVLVMAWLARRFFFQEERSQDDYRSSSGS